MEGGWANLKGTELANLAADALDDIVAAAERGIQRIRATHGPAYLFLRHCSLSLWYAWRALHRWARVSCARRRVSI